MPSMYSFVDFFLIENGFRAAKLLDILLLNNTLFYMFSRFPYWYFSKRVGEENSSVYVGSV